MGSWGPTWVETRQGKLYSEGGGEREGGREGGGGERER